jgi:hypothetical protein
LLFGAVGLLRTLLVVGLLPIGAVGAWRLLRHAGSRPRLVCLVAYLAIPLPYNAIADGQWGGLVLWAAVPFIVGRLGRVTGAPPFMPPRELGESDAPDAPEIADYGFGSPAVRRELLGLALVVAAVAAFVPFVIVLVPVIALALALGAWLAGAGRGALRMVGVALLASGIAAVLHIPWTFDFVLPGSQWSAFAGVKSAVAGISFGSSMRFETGPIGAAPLGWAYLAAAALPLLIGRGWRFGWALRGWVLAVVSWTIAWAAGRAGFPLPLPPADALLAPAALGLAMAAGLGLAAFEQDLRGYRFGWRQAASVVAAVAVAVAVVPVAGSVFDGRWHSPSAGFDTAAGFLGADHATLGPYRVLWVGDPAVLPLGGWRLEDGVAYATTDVGTPTFEDRWAGSSDGPTELIADAFGIATRRETSRLGRLLAPMGVRYVVVPEAAEPFSTEMHRPPKALVDSLVDQLDLSPVDVPSSSLLVFRNTAWAPTRAVVPTGTVGAAGTDYFTEAAATDLSGTEAALPDETGFTTATGPATRDTDVYLGSSSSSRWHLEVGGTVMDRRKAFGWANAFAMTAGGPATLRYRTSPLRWAMLAVEALLVVWCVIFQRRAARAAARPPGSDAAAAPATSRDAVDVLEPVS